MLQGLTVMYIVCLDVTPVVSIAHVSWPVYRIAGPVSANLASKVLKQRPGTVQKAKDVYLALCELEQAETVVVS